MPKLWSESQALTRSPAAPTLESEGMSLSGCKGFRVFLSAASGQTLSGGGSLKAYVFDGDIGGWVRNPDLDIALSASHSGVQSVAFPDQEVSVREGRVFYAASAITVSGGTTVTVRIRGY